MPLHITASMFVYLKHGEKHALIHKLASNTEADLCSRSIFVYLKCIFVYAARLPLTATVFQIETGQRLIVLRLAMFEKCLF